MNFMLPFIFFGFSARINGDRDLILKVVCFLFTALGIYSMLSSVYLGLKRISNYSSGRIAFAALLEKNEHWERSGKSSVLVKTFIFEYIAAGQKYKISKEFKNESSKLIEDETLEPVLYTEEEPEKAELLDGAHAKIFVDEQGLFRLSFPLQGYIYFVVDALMLAFFVFGLLWIFGKIEIVGGMIQFI